MMVERVTPLRLSVSRALRVAIGPQAVELTPRQGLRLAEELARKSLRRAMEEAAEPVATKRQRATR